MNLRDSEIDVLFFLGCELKILVWFSLVKGERVVFFLFCGLWSIFFLVFGDADLVILVLELVGFF